MQLTHPVFLLVFLLWVWLRSGGFGRVWLGCGFCLVPAKSHLHLSFQVREAWMSYELDLINYQNKCKLIRGWDDLFTKVKEHINSVTAMKLSPYFKVGGGKMGTTLLTS